MRADGEVACVEVVELVTDYLEGALPDAVAARVMRHLDSCGACAAYLSEMRLTIQILATLPPQPPSPAVRRRLQRVFHGWAARR